MAEDSGKLLYSWDSPDFKVNKKSSIWYLIFGLVVGLLSIYAFFSDKWFLLAVVLMAGVLILLMLKIKPKVFSHQLTDLGLTVGDSFYNYNRLKSFWIVNNLDNKTLYVLPNSRFGFALALQLGEADVEKVREILSVVLDEEADREEDVLDKIIRMLKF